MKRFAGVIILAAAMVAGGAGADAFDLHRAIEAASPGAVIHVPAGTYSGPIVLTKSIALEGAPGAVIDGGGGGDVMRIEAEDVTIRGFTIRNTGISLDRENAGVTILGARACVENNTFEDVLFGIYLKNAPDSILRGNIIGGKALDVARRGDGIRLWYSPRTRIEDNIITDSRDVVMWFSAQITLRRNTVKNGRYGLHFMYSDDNVLEDNHLEGNSVGAFLMYSKRLTLRRNVFARNRGPSGYGIGLKDMDGVDAQDNLFIGNRIGVYFDNSPSSRDVRDVFRRNVIAYNDIGVAFMPNVQRNTFTDNSFIDNIEQVAVLGTGNFRGNDFSADGRGNFWSDYNGYDLTGDGIGDIEYRSESLFENLMDREPKMRLFLFSPAQQAVEMAARAFPVVRPRPKFIDSEPLMRPVESDARLTHSGSGWPMAGLGAGLIALAALVLFGGQPESRRLNARGRVFASTTPLREGNRS